MVYPLYFKLRGATSKYILRELLKKVLPSDIVKRPKHGFEVPVDNWFRKELKNYAREYLNESRIKKEGIFSWKAVETLLSRHESQEVNLGHQLWSLLVFEIWYERNFS